MVKHRPITEEDVFLTELLIARSYGNLKQSVAQASSDSLCLVGETIKKHPFATAGAAAGAGLLLFGLFTSMNRDRSGKRPGRKEKTGPDLTAEILSLLISTATPYLTAYVERYLGKAVSRGRE